MNEPERRMATRSDSETATANPYREPDEVETLREKLRQAESKLSDAGWRIVRQLEDIEKLRAKVERLEAKGDRWRPMTLLVLAAVLAVLVSVLCVLVHLRLGAPFFPVVVTLRIAGGVVVLCILSMAFGRGVT